MNIYVVSFDKVDENKYNFVTKGIVTDYISFQWIDKYYENGSFNLFLPANEENMNLFKEGLFLLCGESDRCMMIEKVIFNNNLKSDGYIMEITGRSLEAILERRVAFPGQGLSTNEFKGTNGLIKAIYHLINGFFINPEETAVISSDGQKFFYYPERKIDFLTIPEESEWFYDENNPNENILRPFNESINKSVSKDDLLKIISSLCKNTYLGFRIRPYEENGGIKWRFSLYTGKDKSYTRRNKNDPLLLFSPTLKNVESVATTKDITNYRNVIFCGVEKDSEGYINFTSSKNEATGFNQNTGIEIVDKINSGATSLITGVKDRFLTMLEESPLCYTGVFILAMAASRKDKDYTATVTKIEKSDEIRSEIYIEYDAYDHLTTNKIVTEDGTFYFKGKFKQGSEECIISAKIDEDDDITIDGRRYCKMTLPMLSKDKSDIGFYVYTIVSGESYSEYHSAFFDEGYIPAAKLNISKDDKISIYGEGDHSDWNDSNPGLALCDFSGNFLNTEETNCSRVVRGEGFDGRRFYTIDCRVVYKVGSGVSLDAYPTDYISKTDAEKIKITYRRAYGEGEGASNKTDSFILSDINPTIDPETGEELRISFKTSTAAGWLTNPILKQAINDLNNIDLNILERSGLQAWFKTLDKYTDNKNQKRWLCQVYEYDTDNTGLNRREVFVEEDNSDNDEWNASAINQFQSSTASFSVDEDEDEESDEKINERLMESARKRSGEYRRKRDIDVSLELQNFKYMSDDQNGYNLGDIIQVDDGWGNQDQYIITGVTISNDTTSGFKIIPTFERFETIPKQYKRLDYLQVANMILPAKFNRHFTGEQSVTDINLPPNIYFGSRRTDSGEDNPKVSNIKDIKNETIGVITDIECDLAYVKKDVVNGEAEPLSNCFSLISAIGSQERSRTIDPNTGSYTLFDKINIPFALISHKYCGPYHFMTETPSLVESSFRQINMYLGMQASTNDSAIDYKNGDGYKRKGLVKNISPTNLIIYCFTGQDEAQAFHDGEFIQGETTLINNTDSQLSDNLFINEHNNTTNLDEPIINHFKINRIFEENPNRSVCFSNIMPEDPSLTEIPEHIVTFAWFPFSNERWSSLFDWNPTSANPYIKLYSSMNCQLKFFTCNPSLSSSTEVHAEIKDTFFLNSVYSTIQPIAIDIYPNYINHTIEDRDEPKLGIDARSGSSRYANFYIQVTLDGQDYKVYSFRITDRTQLGYPVIEIKNLRKDFFENKIDIERVRYNPGFSTLKDSVFVDYGHNYEKSSGTDWNFNNEIYNEKKIFFTKTTVDDNVSNNRLLHSKPLVNNFYYDKIIGRSSHMQSNTILISEFAPIVVKTDNSQGYLFDNLRGQSNILMSWLGSRNEYKPHINGGASDVYIDETGYGQDNYRMPLYVSSDEPYSLSYNDLLYENHIVLGGCGFYLWDDSGPEHNFLLKFYNSNYQPQTLFEKIFPRACDTNNGVRIYNSIKIYETVCSTRQIWFGDPRTDDCHVYHNDTTVTEVNPDEEIKAYYPDLSTRKLVHEYIPVRYVEGGNDILKEEEYGLYDLVDRIFVPINWGGNSAATFIQAGGEINNE